MAFHVPGRVLPTSWLESCPCRDLVKSYSVEATERKSYFLQDDVWLTREPKESGHRPNEWTENGAHDLWKKEKTARTADRLFVLSH